MKFKVTITPIDEEGKENGSIVTTFTQTFDSETGKPIAHGPSMQCNTTIPFHSITFSDHIEFVRKCEGAIHAYAEYLKNYS